MKANKFFKLKARLSQALDIVEKAVEEVSEVVIIAAKQIVEEVKELDKEVAPVIQPIIEEVKPIKKKKNE